MGQDPLALDPFAQADVFTCALLDIAGQAYGLALHRFFGAQVREKVPVSYWSCHMEPHETAAEAEVGAGLGFANHKLKARSWDIVETVRRMKEAPWPSRQYHEVAVFDDRLWVLEGSRHGNRNDVWYSADGVHWRELPDTPWKPRHAASVFVYEGALWMVAGNNMERDVWKLVRTRV